MLAKSNTITASNTNLLKFSNSYWPKIEDVVGKKPSLSRGCSVLTLNRATEGSKVY
jgi:hypothetical protein